MRSHRVHFGGTRKPADPTWRNSKKTRESSAERRSFRETKFGGHLLDRQGPRDKVLVRLRELTNFESACRRLPSGLPEEAAEMPWTHPEEACQLVYVYL